MHRKHKKEEIKKYKKSGKNELKKYEHSQKIIQSTCFGIMVSELTVARRPAVTIKRFLFNKP